MKLYGCCILLLCFFIQIAHADFSYIHPKPGSNFHNPQTSIILKKNSSGLEDISLDVKGRIGGYYSGSVIFSHNTIIFKPNRPFAFGDTIDVAVYGRDSAFFSFMIKSEDEAKVSFARQSTHFVHPTVPQNVLSTTTAVRTINGVAVPSDFPTINTTIHGETAPGRIFFASTFFDSNSRSNYIVICENDGTPYFYRKYDRADLGTADFKVESNGMLSFYKYINGDEGFHVLMDQHFAEVDTFRAKHGYRTDNHEMVLLDNGHALLTAEDDRRVDMSALVSGGQKNANVVGNHVQEVDGDGNVYWEWRSWDHLNITDVDGINLRGGSIDYVHLNSIAIDYDGNYILSLRSMSEVCKIDSQTGEFIWRFGGVNNQFVSDDEYKLSNQHCARPVPGKPNHYTVYDNGNTRSPQFTRAVEYALDTENMTAHKVWEYRYDKVNFASMMGSVQRLENGNSYIDWSAWPPLRACEVDAENNLLFEIEVQGISSYRSSRFDWQGKMLKPYLLAETSALGVTLIFNKFGDDDVKEYIVYGGTSENNMTQLQSTTNTWTEITELQNNRRHYFKVCAVNSAGERSAFSEVVSAVVNISKPGEDMIVNGDFSDGDTNWRFNLQNGAEADGSVKNGEYHVEISSGKGGGSYSDIQVIQESFPMVQGRQYVFEFDARADANRVIEPRVAENGGDYTVYSKTTPMAITRQKTHYRFIFEMTDPTDNKARVVLNCGTSDINCYFDNVSVKELLPSSVMDDMSVPSIFTLKNYPNPFNPETKIEFSLPMELFVTVTVFDIRGRIVSTLINEKLSAGEHAVTFDAATLPSGVYFYKLETDSIVQVRKMMLVK